MSAVLLKVALSERQTDQPNDFINERSELIKEAGSSSCM